MNASDIRRIAIVGAGATPYQRRECIYWSEFDGCGHMLAMLLAIKLPMRS